MEWLDEREFKSNDLIAALVFVFVKATIRLIIWCWKHKYGIFWYATFVLLSCGSYKLTRKALNSLGYNDALAVVLINDTN